MTTATLTAAVAAVLAAATMLIVPMQSFMLTAADTSRAQSAGSCCMHGTREVYATMHLRAPYSVDREIVFIGCSALLSLLMQRNAVNGDHVHIGHKNHGACATWC